MDKFLRLNLQHFAEEGEGAGAGNNADPAANPEGQQPSGQDPQNPSQEGGKTFTQEDVKRIAAKEKKQGLEKFLKELGFEDFDNAKDGVKKFREWQESQKTEAQKQAERLQEYETKYETVSNENESLKAQIAAMGAGVQADAVQDVVTLAKPLVSDEVDMNAAIEKVLEKYPHFKGEAAEPPKPVYTTGNHQKQRPTEMDQWIQAFKRK
ncbi:hypothetical protein FKN04_22415 [Bacillus glycinifermentans]|uniref:hypothetical protein n=1 Tax=Bacillus glycinifermentans TaxID=1664069 RepID=UPI0015813D4C|nr:hypothetical protein [Bacillus glycinifermentans]NUJ19290.1 hypothetical protein [Bacillus glycinifermentans]